MYKVKHHRYVGYHVEVHRIELHLHQEAKISSKYGNSNSLVALYIHINNTKIDELYICMLH